MAIDASYRAQPYQPLIERAMHDHSAAEALWYFSTLATDDITLSRHHDDPLWLELAPIARQLVRQRPGLLDRAFTTRSWDARCACLQGSAGPRPCPESAKNLRALYRQAAEMDEWVLVTRD
ncbi:hypothetical protein ABZ511_06160 [Nocardia gamkensis]|uniref:hypothetical protein n=1 Tax=Nocardia gamkensis TaxID=352869 RepID=UPI0033C3F888